MNIEQMMRMSSMMPERGNCGYCSQNCSGGLIIVLESHADCASRLTWQNVCVGPLVSEGETESSA
ncbi:MAG: hypothetical protein AW10_00104 [Candidatus Accumulibacter appositus]|uniref:Uncharacterized protein n=1 Tax=Candidatus Accumulibacter appositus TaxID=1454003 RepID=A0A011P6B9_9PROT|nr:MAG: hypothetical protein AW10_00104 [Candidatus Accumulibacter appositus]